MKKRVWLAVILILGVLFVTQDANADVIITAVRSNTFNLGDEVLLRGYARAPSTDTWTLTQNLQCDDRITQINKRVVSLTFDERIDFNENVRLNDFGNCIFLVKFSSASGTNEEASSSSFTVTKQLKGDFLLDKTKAHFGDTVKLTGTVRKLDGGLVNGYGSVSIKKDNENYVTSSINIIEGALKYSTSIDRLPQGSFVFEISVRDTYGNEHLFTNVATLEVTNKLTLNLRLSETTIRPSDKIDILGEITDVNGKNVKNGEAIIKVDFDEFKALVIDGVIDYSYKSPKTINSNDHTMHIIVKDEHENTGEITLRFNVVPIVTTLDIETNKDAYFPKEAISITPFLYDQADEQISKDVTLEIYNAANEIVLTKTTESNAETLFKLTDYATPGTWKIKASSSGLTDELTFDVKEVNDILTTLENQIITVKNVGNVDYTEDLEIIAEGSEKTFTISKRTKLKPDETLQIYLYKDIPKGTYDISITNTKFKAEDIEIIDPRSIGNKFGDYFNSVTGSVVQSKGSTTSMKPIITLFAFILVIVLLVFVSRYSAKAKLRRRREYDKKQGMETFGKIIRDKEKEMQKTEIKDRSQYRRGFGMREESPELSDIKKRVESDLKRSPINKNNDYIEMRSNKNYSGNENENKNNEKKGLFRMFD
ncbi:MAG TPA: hypothetical protein VJH20_05340 [Candidatus Nanoarchaeia archaeon]|nr:hypothetical protein [Candidatus Nanoarchaeia archaeon]